MMENLAAAAAPGLFEQAFGLVGTFGSYLLPFLFVLAIVIFVHELGHFLVGRWCGVRVETFSLGFGPRLAGFTDGHGTQWKIAAIPLGGYVKFKGDLNAASSTDFETVAAMSEEDRRESFPLKPLWQRAAIVAAGPAANFLFALVIFAGIFMIYGRTVVEPVIANVVPGSAAAEAGFLPGDRVLSINGRAIESFDALSRAVGASAGERLIFTVERKGSEVSLNAAPRITERKSPFGTHRAPVLGIGGSPSPEHHRLETYGPVQATALAGQEIFFVIDRTVAYLGGLIAGREKADQLSGPVRIAHVSGKVAEQGIGALVSLAAILSISIGFVNLLPVPMLDGGHLMFYLYEAVLGRPLGPRTQELGFKIGFALVIMLMLFVTWNDIAQLTGL